MSSKYNNNKKHGNVFKNWLCPSFLLLPKKSELPKLWGGCSPGPLAPPARTPMIISLFVISKKILQYGVNSIAAFKKNNISSLTKRKECDRSAGLIVGISQSYF